MLFTPLFRDRAEAGEKLAQAILSEFTKFNLTAEDAVKPIVYALPRGGLPIAVPIARLLNCPLDVLVAKKITRSDNPELAIGALTAGGHVLWSKQKPRNFRVQNATLQKAQEKALSQLADLSPGRPVVSPKGALVILVDDGIATGMTMAVAVQALQKEKPAQIWVCVPVAPPEFMEFMDEVSDRADSAFSGADRAIILETPEPFFSVSRFYEEFPQVETEEALACLYQQTEWLSEG